MFHALAILLVFQLAGELLARTTNIPLPGALLGTLLLLLGLLFYKRLPLSLEKTSQVLLQNMMLLFIPIIAGVMLEFDHLRREWLPFVMACVAGAAVTFTATAITFRFFLQRKRAKDEASAGNQQESA